MLMEDLMIILFHLKLDKFYCTGVMNSLQMTYYDFFSLTVFVHIKISYYWFNRQKLLQKTKNG